jgi:predicted RNA methylase
VSKIAGLLPTHTRRSEESQAMQQFSTPAPLGLAAMTAAAITPTDIVLEPSAGTGLLAILAEISGGALLLNELADARADLLASLSGRHRHTLRRGPDRRYLAPSAMPSVVLMNPPFSVLANVSVVADAAYRHIASALARLVDGGRLVDHRRQLRPGPCRWRDAFVRLQERGTITFTAAIDGSVYAARHDHRHPARRHRQAPRRRSGRVSGIGGIAPDVATLLGWIEAQIPASPSLAGGRRPHGRQALAPCADTSRAPQPPGDSPRSSPRRRTRL